MPVKRADKTPMPVREAQKRAHDFLEVNAGYTDSHARFEAERCLRCQDPVCVDGCPVNVPIPEFIHAVAMGDMAGAAKILRSANPLPAICGRVCPQESQCEAECSMTARFNPVAIGHLERFVADWERTQPPSAKAKIHRDEKIAIIGAGPVGTGLRGRARAARLPGHDLRGAARRRRRAALRHPGVPPAQGKSSTGRSGCSRRWASRSSAT